MKARENELHIISVLLDLLVLNVAILLVAFVFCESHLNKFSDLYVCFLLSNLSWVMAYLFVRKKMLYLRKGFRPRFYRILKRIGVFLLIEILLFVPLIGVIGHLWFFMLLSTFTFVFVKLAANFVYFKGVRYYYRRSSRVKKVLLVGDNETMRKVKLIIKSNPVLNYKYIGSLSNIRKGKKILGKLNDFSEVVKAKDIQVVFVEMKSTDGSLTNNIDKKALLHTCNQLGVRLYYVPENEKIEKGEDMTVRIDGIDVINPQKIPMDHIENQFKKRAFDLVFSGLVIVFVLSWLYPLMAILIKLNSKGPVLFSQERTGINKLTFNCHKFRSMRVNAEADLKQATGDDPRITRIGKFLRKSNFDELPQFINVFQGHMSVVGPRPHMLTQTDAYALIVDDYLVRHYVKPGITGWAQINGLRGETDELWKMEKRVEYDKEYINNWSLDWDFVIIWKTIFSLKAFMNAG